MEVREPSAKYLAKPAYKQTEVGFIPADWGVSPLEAFTKVVASGKSKHSKALGTYPVHGSTGIIGYTESPEYEGEAILVARVGANAGRINVVSGRYGVTDNTIMLRLDDAASLAFIWRSLEAKHLNSLVFGSGQPLITGTQLKSIQLATPPLPEQHAIAAALSDVDGLLDGMERLIAKKRDLKQAAMQQLLTGQTRLPGFSGKWEVISLRDAVATPITDGPHLTPKFLPTGIPFLSVNNLVRNRIDFSSLRFISLADHIEFSKKCEPRRGDILFGKAASVGMVALIETDMELNIWSPLALIRVSRTMSERFVFYALQACDIGRQIKLLTNASSQGNIGMSDIGLLQVPMPSLPEQTAIAAILSDMDAEISALVARRDKTRDLKQAMMQELLTGRTRLV